MALGQQAAMGSYLAFSRGQESSADAASVALTALFGATLVASAGAAVYLVRYHDHGRVFRMPAVLRATPRMRPESSKPRSRVSSIMSVAGCAQLAPL